MYRIIHRPPRYGALDPARYNPQGRPPLFPFAEWNLKQRMIGVCALLLFLARATPATAAPPSEKFELRDNDRVAFLGNTFFEREHAHSYLETLLATRHPERNVTFRNIAWSGDTVFGDARAAFDTREQGFERLIKIATDVKPTVLFVCYGMGESFEGEAGLSSFRQGLLRLLDRLDTLKARTVLVSPNRHENLGPPFPNPDRHNQDLQKYIAVLKEVADARGYWFVNLYDLLGDGLEQTPSHPFTDNGIHLTAYGYWRAAHAVEEGLGYPPRGWTGEIDAAAGHGAGDVLEVAPAGEGGALGITRKNELLPAPPAPTVDARVVPDRPEWRRVLKVTGLAEGHWTLVTDKVVLAAASADEWANGVALVSGPLAEQAEEYRRLAVLKNMQFFNQWRPQNETYLFGFRKNEQGRNAREIPMFDKPIAEFEAKLAELRAAKPQKYRLQREDK